MADKEQEKSKELANDEVGLVSLSQETGVGIRMPDGEVIDLTSTDIGTAQVLTYLVKTLSDIKKNIG